MHACSFMSDSLRPHELEPAKLCMEFSSQEYQSGLPFPSAGDLPNLGTEPESSASPVLVGGFFTTAPPGKPH